MSKQSLTLTQLMDEPTNRITFWSNSTDVICPPESPHSHKGTARHFMRGQVWDLVGSHCPRCNDDWGRAKDGTRPCLTRGCYTWKETGKHTPPPPPISEEDIVFSEFEDDLHEYISNNISANENVNIPPTESNVMSDPRDQKQLVVSFDDEEVVSFDDDESHSRPNEEGEITGGKKYEKPHDE